MKKDIHPKYYDDAKIICACGNTIVTGSTKQELKTELCSACHPFYTGKQKLVDTAGRVDKFQEKRAKAKALKENARPPKKARKAKVEKIASPVE